MTRGTIPSTSKQRSVAYASTGSPPNPNAVRTVSRLHAVSALGDSHEWRYLAQEQPAYEYESCLPSCRRHGLKQRTRAAFGRLVHSLRRATSTSLRERGTARLLGLQPEAQSRSSNRPRSHRASIRLRTSPSATDGYGRTLELDRRLKVLPLPRPRVLQRQRQRSKCRRSASRVWRVDAPGRSSSRVEPEESETSCGSLSR